MSSVEGTPNRERISRMAIYGADSYSPNGNVAVVTRKTPSLLGTLLGPVATAAGYVTGQPWIGSAIGALGSLAKGDIGGAILNGAQIIGAPKVPANTAAPQASAQMPGFTPQLNYSKALSDMNVQQQAVQAAQKAVAAADVPTVNSFATNNSMTGALNDVGARQSLNNLFGLGGIKAADRELQDSQISNSIVNRINNQAAGVTPDQNRWNEMIARYGLSDMDQAVRQQRNGQSGFQLSDADKRRWDELMAQYGLTNMDWTTRQLMNR